MIDATELHAKVAIVVFSRKVACVAEPLGIGVSNSRSKSSLLMIRPTEREQRVDVVAIGGLSERCD